MTDAIKHFRKTDPTLYEVAKMIELTKWVKPKDPLTDLIESIISQQLSIKAADTIFNRFKKLFPKKQINPKNLIKLKDKELRECGISYSKIGYIKGIANAVIDKKIDFVELEKLNDEEVLVELTKLKGVGVWTAEMYLMFTLGRPDIFSAEDLGLQNAMIRIYKLNKKPKKEILLDISSRWSPYRTTASRILWKTNDLRI